MKRAMNLSLFLVLCLAMPAHTAETLGPHQSSYAKGCVIWGGDGSVQSDEGFVRLPPTVMDGAAACVRDASEIRKRLSCPGCQVGFEVVCRNGTWTGTDRSCQSETGARADDKTASKRDSSKQSEQRFDLTQGADTTIPDRAGKRQDGRIGGSGQAKASGDEMMSGSPDADLGGIQRTGSEARVDPCYQPAKQQMESIAREIAGVPADNLCFYGRRIAELTRRAITVVSGCSALSEQMGGTAALERAHREALQQSRDSCVE